MGFTISLRCGDIGRATHRQDAEQALVAARDFAIEPGAEVQIASDLGERFTVEAFAAEVAKGRFKPPGAARRPHPPATRSACPTSPPAARSSF